jgi:hypothetical protein
MLACFDADIAASTWPGRSGRLNEFEQCLSQATFGFIDEAFLQFRGLLPG